MNYLEGRVASLERQRSRTTFSHVATEERSGYLWKTLHHPGRTSSKTRYFVLTKSSLDHFRNHHRVITIQDKGYCKVCKGEVDQSDPKFCPMCFYFVQCMYPYMCRDANLKNLKSGALPRLPFLYPQKCC